MKRRESSDEKSLPIEVVKLLKNFGHQPWWWKEINSVPLVPVDQEGIVSHCSWMRKWGDKQRALVVERSCHEVHFEGAPLVREVLPI
jgi:hypothetical protein